MNTATPPPNEGQVANDRQLEQVSELTDPAVVADVEQPRMVRLKSPMGAVTEVPESIVGSLTDSGYTKVK